MDITKSSWLTFSKGPEPCYQTALAYSCLQSGLRLRKWFLRIPCRLLRGLPWLMKILMKADLEDWHRFLRQCLNWLFDSVLFAPSLLYSLPRHDFSGRISLLSESRSDDSGCRSSALARDWRSPGQTRIARAPGHLSASSGCCWPHPQTSRGSSWPRPLTRNCRGPVLSSSPPSPHPWALFLTYSDLAHSK